MGPEIQRRTTLPLLATAAISLIPLNLPDRGSHDPYHNNSYVSTVQERPVRDSGLQTKLGNSAEVRSEVITANPVKTIYAIREFHPSSSLPTALYKETINLQRGIAAIAQTAIDELGVKGVYKDGITSKSLNDIQKQEDFAKTLTDKEKMILASEDPVSEIKNLYKTATTESEKQRAKDLYTYGSYTEHVRHEAITALAKNGIKILETEGVTEFNIANATAIDTGPESKEFKASSEQREKFIIGKIMESPDPSALIIMGYNHDFSDQVKAHNATNPQSQIRLVVIDPKGINELAGKILK